MTATSLLFCEQIMTETLSGKSTLVGVFSSFSSEEFPVILPHLCVYGQVTSSGEAATALLTLAHTGQPEKPCYSTNISLPGRDPGSIFEIKQVIRSVRFETPGLYTLSISLDSCPLCQTTLTVREIPGPHAAQ